MGHAKMAFGPYAYATKINDIPLKDCTGNFPVKSMYTVLSLMSPIVAPIKRSHSVFGSSGGFMSMFISLMFPTSSMIWGFLVLVIFFVVDLRYFLVRAMCPFAVAVDGGRYFCTAFAVSPGHDKK